MSAKGTTHEGKYDEAVSSFVDDFWRNKFRSPTIKEVMAACGITSTSVAYYVIRKIAKTRGDVFAGSETTHTRITPQWVIAAIKNARS
jgi:hypothetical protein